MQIKKMWACVLATMFITGLVIGATPVSSSSEEWTLIHDGRDVKAYPDLKEYVWQKNASAPPHGPCDKIGLRRLVKAGTEPQGVVFILPGTWSSGEQLISNPPEDNWTAHENNSLSLYLANNDFDVYSIDYRTHFVDPYLDPENLSFIVDWGWDQWISDIKEAVEKAKEVSGAEKIYLAGESFGGEAAANYASLYWEEDLEGIILLDGGTAAKDPELVTNTYNLTAEIEEMNATGTWSTEVGAPYEGTVFIMQYAEEHPDAPAEYPPGHPLEGQLLPPGIPFDNITEWAAFVIYWAWGPGGVSNIYGGYGNTSVMIHMMATFDRYWPTRLSLESAAIRDWNSCLYVTHDFDDHYCEIDVPLLGFLSEFGLDAWGSFRHGIANPDFTGIVLKGYGHLDVYAGNYAREDVNEPTYQWLMGARILTVTSSPVTGVMFTIDGVPQTTPYTEWLPEGSYTLEMPETHTVGEAKYYWNQWSDEVTSRSRTVTMNTITTLTGDFAGPYYELTIASSPITGIAFTIDGISKTTSYTEWLPEGTYTIVMPYTHNGYVWSHWLEDGDTNRIKTVTLPGTTWTAVYKRSTPVGGKAAPINIPTNKPETPTLWIWLTILLPLAATTILVKLKKKKP